MNPDKIPEEFKSLFDGWVYSILKQFPSEIDYIAFQSKNFSKEKKSVILEFIDFVLASGMVGSELTSILTHSVRGAAVPGPKFSRKFFEDIRVLFV